MKRIAFITDEYPTTMPTAGGLATYVQNISELLASYSHEVHVFVRADQSKSYIRNKVLIHEISNDSNIYLLLSRLACRVSFLSHRKLEKVLKEISISFNLGKALVQYEHKNGSFDWVQSADFRFRGIFVSARRRPHIVRCSWSRSLWNKHLAIDQHGDEILYTWMENFMVSNASLAYAPSKFISDYLSSRLGIKVDVVRPPLIIRADPNAKNKIPGIPSKYLLHFGQIFTIKGCDYVFEAFRFLKDSSRPIDLVVAGVCYEHKYIDLMSQLGIIYLGPLPRSVLAQIIAKAHASVLPSRADNLPNTAIESLSLGIPVITMTDCSIDELITHDSNGWVVPQGDVEGLAEAMWNAWMLTKPLLKDAHDLRSESILASMRPAIASQNLLEYAKRASLSK